MLPKHLFLLLYMDTLESTVSEYIYDDYDDYNDDDDRHYWSDWFHNLLALMQVPPELYTIAYDTEVEEDYNTRICDYQVETVGDSRYLWYTIFYDLGYRTPPFTTIKEL